MSPTDIDDSMLPQPMPSKHAVRTVLGMLTGLLRANGDL